MEVLKNIYEKGLRRRFGRENTRKKEGKNARLPLSVRAALWLALRWRHIPVCLAPYLGGFLSVPALLAKPAGVGSERLPRRVGLRRIKGNAWDGDRGRYRFGTMPLTVGARFGTVQAIEDGDAFFEPLRLYFGLRRIEVALATLGKAVAMINHIRADQEARTERDKRTVVPLSELQQRAGLGDMKHGLFGVIDFVACRNHLTYAQVYEMSDTQLYGILMIEHDRAIAQRRLEQVARQRQEQQAAAQRARARR